MSTQLSMTIFKCAHSIENAQQFQCKSLLDHPVILVGARGRPAQQVQGVFGNQRARTESVPRGLAVGPLRHPLPILVAKY